MANKNAKKNKKKIIHIYMIDCARKKKLFLYSQIIRQWFNKIKKKWMNEFSSHIPLGFEFECLDT